MGTATTWPIFDVAEMAQEASDRAGIEFRSGYSLRSARRSLELLSIEWANRGLNLWTIEGPISINLQPGVAQYSLPEDTVDLIEHQVRTWSGPIGGPLDPGSRYNDIPVERMTLSEYANINNKNAQGRPTIIHIRRQVRPFFLLWMVPPVTPVFQLVIWRMRRMRSVGSGAEGIPEIPWRFIPAMTAGLAYYLALKSKDPNVLQKVDMLKSTYEEQFQLASDEDRDRASFRFVPGGYDFL